MSVFKNKIHNYLILIIIISFLSQQIVLSNSIVNNNHNLPTSTSYQGFLKNNNGELINDKVKIVFRLYNVSEDGEAIWEEIHESVLVNMGLFNVVLGSIVPFTSDLFVDNLFLGIQIEDNSELKPRKQFLSVPYAFVAKELIGKINGSQIEDNSIDITKLSFIDSSGNWDFNKDIKIGNTMGVKKLKPNESPEESEDYIKIYAKDKGVNYNSDNSLVNGLVMYLKLDETSGSQILDSSGNSDATSYSQPAIVEGLKGKARYFDNSKQQYIIKKHEQNIDFGNQNFSVAFWMKGDTPENWTVIIGKANNWGSSISYYGWQFANTDFAQNTALEFSINPNGTEDRNDKFVIASDVFDNQWHHVVGVRNGDTISIYIDGKSIDIETNVDQSVSIDSPLSIGSLEKKYPFKGTIDEIAMWNRALSDSEIDSLYNNGNYEGIPCVDEKIYIKGSDGVEKEISPWNKDGVNIFTDANVGIGTDKPKAKLNVAGPSGASIKIGTTSNSLNAGTVNAGHSEIRSTWDDNFSIKTFDNTPNPNFVLGIGDGKGGYAHMPIMWNNMLILNGSNNSWCPSCGTSVDEKHRADMVISSNGNVGIGTINPQEKLEINGAIKFSSNGSTINKAPRVIHTSDPNSGCPGNRPANTDLFIQEFEIDNTASVYIQASIIRNYSGRADLYLYVDGKHIDQTLTFTSQKQWEDAHVHWCGILDSGKHVVSLRSNIANIWGCGPSWGAIDTIIFE